MSVELARLTATLFYLNELEKTNMVTPSIAQPYTIPRPISKEALLAHKCNRNIQQLRINRVKGQIEIMKADNVSICIDTLIEEKCKFLEKVNFLIEKYKPDPGGFKFNSNNDGRKRKKNKRSRERYLNRQFQKKLNDFKNNPEKRTVINLSSVDIPIQDLFALEIGHGFVLSPNNVSREEELLILEGFRFIDRLGKADKAQRSNMNNDSNSESRNPTVSPSNSSASNTVSSQNNSTVTNDNNVRYFERGTSVPQKLHSYQPLEVDLKLAETKFIKK